MRESVPDWVLDLPTDAFREMAANVIGSTFSELDRAELNLAMLRRRRSDRKLVWEAASRLRQIRVDLQWFEGPGYALWSGLMLLTPLEVDAFAKEYERRARPLVRRLRREIESQSGVSLEAFSISSWRHESERAAG